MERPVHTLSVLIPAYDEEAAIAAIVERVLALRPRLRQCGITATEVIVIDDGSRDRTAESVPQVEGVRLVRHQVNRGYGAAIKTGLAHAHGDLIAFLDGDGTYAPEAFPQLCAAALDGADVVIGSRMTDRANGMPASRRLGNRLFAGLVTVLGDRRVHDCASGMRVVRREVLPRLYPLPDGLNFTPIMSLRAMHEGLRMVEVPIPYGTRVGNSKLEVARDGLRYAQSILWTALSYNPVRILGALGLAGVALAGVVGAGLVVVRLQGITHLGPWGVAAIFVALVAGVAGVSVFSLGAMFNYLVTLFRKRPVRMGLFGKPIFHTPLERHFGWAGLVIGGVGLILAAATLALGIHGWDVSRLWLYLVGSALFILVGVQLLISRILMRTLEELSARELPTNGNGSGHDT